MVGGIVGGDLDFLRGDKHGGMVVDSDLLKKLVGVGAGFDRGNSRISTHVDFFKEFPHFRPSFYGSFCGGGGVVGTAFRWKKSVGLVRSRRTLTCRWVCGLR